METAARRADAIVDWVFEKFAVLGHRRYSEEVTELEHALQSATLAERAGEKPSLVAACLLHDFGHLVHGLAEDIADHGIDGCHEEAGHEALRGRFVASVVDPGRLHVAAKRYLCTVDEAYLAGLSPASARSLELQGGTMSPAEVAAFEAEPFFEDAVTLRKYDDLGKIVDMSTPNLEHFRPLLARFVLPASELEPKP